jgi:phospholipase/carboxylesterase
VRAELERPHRWRPGTDPGAGPPLLFLHGTGGDEDSLTYLHETLAPRVPALSVRGLVQENGMNRFFRRLAEGVLDEADLTVRTHELAAFLHVAAQAYRVRRFVAVGFSNGANMATALLLHHPDLLAAVVAIAAMPPFRALPDGLPSGPRRAMVVNGASDALVSEEMTDGLVTQLRTVGATVELLRHAGGHEVPAQLQPAIAAFVAAAA